MSDWRMGVVTISKESLKSMLRLSREEYTIKYVTVDNDKGMIQLFVEGPLMPEIKPGDDFREVQLVYAKDEEGAPFLKDVQWPNEDSTTG